MLQALERRSRLPEREAVGFIFSSFDWTRFG
jgi:hypothetical protein